MTSQMVLSGQKRPFPLLGGVVDVRRMSKPTLSWVILAATAFVIALVLLIWLLMWLNRPRAGIEGWWIAQRGLALPVIGHQADDLGGIVRAASATPARDLGYSSLEESVRSRLAAAGSRPIVVYLSAAGVSDEQGAYLLRPELGSLALYTAAGSRQSLLNLEKLVDLFVEYPSRKKLLILDAGQVGSDRNLGVFANGFLQHLKSYLDTKKPKGLAILSSCAPGQVSWASEADRCSVFGHFVALGLSGKAAGFDPTGHGVTVRGLHNYVCSHVKSWVAANRQAEQTPELLGDPSVNFALPRSGAPRRAEAGDADERDGEVMKRLEEGWVKRETLEKYRPYRHTPLLWRRYQETLLRAERLIRVGDREEADDILDSLAELEKKIADDAGGLPMDPFWSLGLLERSLVDPPGPAEGRSTELAAANTNIDRVLKELAGGAGEAEPPVEEKPEEPAEVGDNKKARAQTQDAAKPQPEHPEPTGSTRDVAKSPRPLAPAKSSPRGELASSTLIAMPGDLRPQYVEAQVLIWATLFVRRDPAPYAFKGQRGAVLGDALQTRRLAEKAAASDERIGRWIVPLVEAGDALRRRAQDGLFAGDTRQFPTLARLLEQSRERYRQALDVADRASKALDLLEKIEAELPYYGEWKARRSLRRDEELEQSLVDLMKASAALARLIQAEVPSGPAGPDGEVGSDDPLAAHLGHVRKWDAVSRELRGGFDRLREEFQGQCAGLASSGGSGRWREIDAALVVPMIESGVRRRLLHRVRSSPAAGTLAGLSAAAPAPGPSRATNFRTYARERAERASLAERGRADRRDELADVEATAEAPSVPDPEFWKVALGLARLEWGLFEIGGASETDLARVSDAYESARNSLKGAPALAFDAFSKLSDLLRGLRAERLRTITQSRGQTYAPLAAADRSVRVVPPADALVLSDAPVVALDRYARHALLLWHGNRLLHDFAPEHASQVFENARQFLDTESLRAAIGAAGSMRRAKLAVTPEPADTLMIDDWSEKPMRVGLEAIGNVPAGDATVLVGFDPAQPLSVVEKTSRASSREGILVPVRSSAMSDRSGYAVARSESSSGAVTVGLHPTAFYRGRFFTAERDVNVTMQRANDAVTVTIQQSYEGLKFKDFADQFKEHPGQGYLHYGTNLRYKLVLTTDTPKKVVVRYGLQEHTDSYKTKTLEIGPKRKGEIFDIIKGSDFQFVKGGGAQQPEDAPLNLLVTIWKDQENGVIQGRAKYVFRRIPPSQYISTSAEFDPSTRTLHLWVTHLASDPVTGPVDVFASIGGALEKDWIRRSRIAPFSFRVPPSVRSVTWRVGIENVPDAFRETIETPPAGGVGATPPPQ